MTTLRFSGMTAVFATYGETLEGHHGAIFHYALPGGSDAVLKLEFLLQCANVYVATYGPSDDNAGLVRSWTQIGSKLWCDVDYDEIVAAAKRSDLHDAHRILRDIMSHADVDESKRGAMNSHTRAMLQSIADVFGHDLLISVEPDRAELWNRHPFSDWQQHLIHAVVKHGDPRGWILGRSQGGQLESHVVMVELKARPKTKEAETMVRNFIAGDSPNGLDLRDVQEIERGLDRLAEVYPAA